MHFMYVFSTFQDSSNKFISAINVSKFRLVGRSQVRFPMLSLEFFIDVILPAAPWPWGQLSL